MTTTYSPTQLDDDVKRFLDLKAKAEDLTLEMETIKTRLRDSLGTGQVAAPCGVTVTISPQRRFNASEAEKVLPESLLTLCTASVIDSKKAKANLPPALYDQCMIEVGAPRVVIA